MRAKLYKAPQWCLACFCVVLSLNGLLANAEEAESTLKLPIFNESLSVETSAGDVDYEGFVEPVEPMVNESDVIVVKPIEKMDPFSKSTTDLQGKEQPEPTEKEVEKPKVEPSTKKEEVKTEKKVETSAGAEKEQLWNTIEFFSESLDVLPKWQRVLRKIDEEEILYEDCAESVAYCKTSAQLQWRTFMRRIERTRSTMTELELLDEVNFFFNQWEYIEDIYNWQKSDYWASPQEFLRKAGDCEDYSIIKYVTLKKLGYNVDDLRIAVVKDTVRNIAHAVLMVYNSEGKIYILDSLINETLPQNALLQYTPYYSVNETGRWVHIAPIKE